MNNSLNNLSESAFYFKLGSYSEIFDNIQLYFFAPYSFYCILSSILAFIVLLDTNICQQKIYNYFRIIVFNNIILCSLVFLNVFVHIPRYSSISITYPARLLSCNILFTLIITFYSFSNLITTLSMIHRLSGFVLKFARFKHMKTFKSSSCVWIFFILINMPLFFMFKTPTQNEFEDLLRKNEKLDLCFLSNFGQNSIVYIIYIIIFIIDNVVSLTIEFIAELASAVYINKFLKTNFGLQNIITADRAFKSVNPVSNRNNLFTNSESQDFSNDILRKYPIMALSFFLLVNVVH